MNCWPVLSRKCLLNGYIYGLTFIDLVVAMLVVVTGVAVFGLYVC